MLEPQTRDLYNVSLLTKLFPPGPFTCKEKIRTLKCIKYYYYYSSNLAVTKCTLITECITQVNMFYELQLREPLSTSQSQTSPHLIQKS